MRKHDDNLTVAIRRSRHEGWMEFLMPKCHGRCQQIYTENVEFNIEHRIYYLARRFYSGLDARVIYSHLIGL